MEVLGATGGASSSPTKSGWDSAKTKSTERSLIGKDVGTFREIVRKISLMVRIGSNPSGSRPNFFGRQHLTFNKGGKDMVWGKGLLSFCNGCGNGSIWCNGRGKQGKDALSVCAQGLCKDAKPTKHTQTLTLRKARGIVRM